MYNNISTKIVSINNVIIYKLSINFASIKNPDPTGGIQHRRGKGNEGCTRGRMQEMRMQDRKDAGHRRDAGEEKCRKGAMLERKEKEGNDECRKGRMLERKET